MNQNYNYMKYYYPYDNSRIAGGFVFPFLLGGVTGAALAPAFWNNNNQNNMPMYYFVPAPMPQNYYYPRSK